MNKADFFLRFAQNSFVTYWYTQHNDALLYFQHDTLLPAKLVLERFAPVHRGSVHWGVARRIHRRVPLALYHIHNGRVIRLRPVLGLDVAHVTAYNDIQCVTNEFQNENVNAMTGGHT